MGRKTKEPRPEVIQRKPSSELTPEVLAEVRSDVPDGSAVDASLIAAGLRLQDVKVPLVEEASGYCTRLIDLSLSPEEAVTLRRIDIALDLQGARLDCGRKVNGQAAAVKWLLQRLASIDSAQRSVERMAAIQAELEGAETAGE